MNGGGGSSNNKQEIEHDQQQQLHSSTEQTDAGVSAADVVAARDHDHGNNSTPNVDTRQRLGTDPAASLEVPFGDHHELNEKQKQQQQQQDTSTEDPPLQIHTKSQPITAMHENDDGCECECTSSTKSNDSSPPDDDSDDDVKNNKNDATLNRITATAVRPEQAPPPSSQNNINNNNNSNNYTSNNNMRNVPRTPPTAILYRLNDEELSLGATSTIVEEPEEEEDDNDDENDDKRRWCWSKMSPRQRLAIAVLGFLLVSSILALVVRTIVKNSGRGSDSAAKQQRAQRAAQGHVIQQILVTAFSSSSATTTTTTTTPTAVPPSPPLVDLAAELQNSQSSYTRALQWITWEDPARLDPAVVRTTTLLQRYILVQVHFSTTDSITATSTSTTDLNGGARVSPMFLGRNSWMTGDPVCQWSGIICSRTSSNTTNNNDNDTIRGIQLSGLGLSGPFPKSLLYLSNLQSLDLSHNQLTGVMPLSDAVWSYYWPVLTTLQLQHNLLTGTQTLSDAATATAGSNTDTVTAATTTSLKNNRPFIDIDLSSNELQGSLDSMLVNLLPFMGLYISQLDLSQNSLTGTIPNDSSIRALSNLQVFDLQDNQLHGTLPEALSFLPRLRILRLQRNPGLTGSVPESVCRHFQTNVYPTKNTTTTTTTRESVVVVDFTVDCSLTFSPGCCSHCCNGTTGICISLLPSSAVVTNTTTTTAPNITNTTTR